jgi:membrane protease YdiL (CAAX protease family)
MQQPESIPPENIHLPENIPAPVIEPVKPGLWAAWPTVGLSIAILAINGLAQTIVVLVFAIKLAGQSYSFSDSTGIQRFLNDLMADGQMLSLAIIISALAGIAATIWFIKIHKGFSIAEYLGLKRISLKTILILLAVFVVMMGLSIGIGMLQNTPQGGDIFSDAYHNTPWPVVFWLGIVVFGPIFEETLFRGFLFVGLKQSVLGIAGTIVLTGLVFALMHAAQYGAGVIAEIFIMGLIFGVVRWKTGSLWSSILLHALWNTAQMVFITFFPTFGS